MKHQLIRSADKTFYYLIALDEENNETLVAENADLTKLRQEFPEAANLKVVDEHETVDTVKVDEEK